MSTHAHARRRLASFAALFGYREDRPARPLVHVGAPGFGTDVYFPPSPPAPPAKPPHGIATPETLARLREQAEAQQRQEEAEATVTMPVSAIAPVHMVSDETAVMPCCGMTSSKSP